MESLALIKFDSQYFNIKDTLKCGQFFRFKPFDKGYLVCSLDKCCYAYQEGEFSFIECLKIIMNFLKAEKLNYLPGVNTDGLSRLSH